MKGEAKPKHKASNKRAFKVTYDAAKENAIHECMTSGLWKAEMCALGLGRHVFVREIPGDNAEGPTVSRFWEDCNIHLVYLVGVTTLDILVDYLPSKGTERRVRKW